MFLIIIFFSSIVWRLYELQITEGETYLELSKKNFLRNLPSPAPRGEIITSDGEVVARDTISYVVTLTPSDIIDVDETVNFISSTLGITKELIDETLLDTSLPFYYPRTIAVGSPLEKVLKVKLKESNYPGVKVEMYPVREYPKKSEFAHLLGYVQEIDKKELQNLSQIGYIPGDRIGKAGVERKYEVYLKGTKGEKIYKVDATGKDRELIKETEAKKGNSLVLTVSNFLQEKAVEMMKDINGAFVMINPKNGMVLAMVSNPTYDPNYFVKGITPSLWSDWNRKNVLVNKAVQGQYPPGSTFKPFVGLSTLERNVIDGRYTVNCQGSIIAGRREFKCWVYPGGHGSVNIKDALAVSCNIFFYSIAKELGIDSLVNDVKRLGFGKTTGIDLPIESSGFVPDPSWKLEKKKEPWYLGDTLNIGIGQGFLLVTPIQLAVYYSFLVNGGHIVTPYLVDRVVSSEGEIIYKAYPELKKVEVSSKNLEIIKEGLRKAVTRGGGLTPIKELPIDVSAKTGTAQTTTGGRPHLWITAYAPSDDPEVVMVLLAEKSKFDYAYYLAPYMKQMLEAWLEFRGQVEGD